MNKTLSAALIFLAILTGCASNDLVPNTPPETLYKKAVSEAADKHWETAKRYVDYIREQYPFSPYAVEAELLSAEMLYRQDLFQAAITAYGSFEELHPFHAKAPYALYMRGMSSFNLIDGPDRDMAHARNAVLIMERFIRQYPGDSKAPDAKAKMLAAINVLAEHELNVARYYVRKDNPEAALARLKGLIKDFPNSSSRPEAEKMAKELEEKLAAAKKGG